MFKKDANHIRTGIIKKSKKNKFELATINDTVS